MIYLSRDPLVESRWKRKTARAAGDGTCRFAAAVVAAQQHNFCPVIDEYTSSSWLRDCEPFSSELIFLSVSFEAICGCQIHHFPFFFVIPFLSLILERWVMTVAEPSYGGTYTISFSEIEAPAIGIRRVHNVEDGHVASQTTLVHAFITME